MQMPQANLGTAPKLWSDRDFDECCYPVSGIGPSTMVCAEPCRGAYCVAHRKELDARLVNAKAQANRPARKPRQAAARRPPLPRKALSEKVVTQVLADVCRDWGVLTVMVMSPSRDPDVTFARHMVMWRLRQLGYSFPSIGRAMGRDQSSAQHGNRRIDDWVAEQERAA